MRTVRLQRPLLYANSPGKMTFQRTFKVQQRFFFRDRDISTRKLLAAKKLKQKKVPQNFSIRIDKLTLRAHERMK